MISDHKLGDKDAASCWTDLELIKSVTIEILGELFSLIVPKFVKTDKSSRGTAASKKCSVLFAIQNNSPKWVLIKRQLNDHWTSHAVTRKQSVAGLSPAPL